MIKKVLLAGLALWGNVYALSFTEGWDRLKPKPPHCPTAYVLCRAFTWPYGYARYHFGISNFWSFLEGCKPNTNQRITAEMICNKYYGGHSDKNFYNPGLTRGNKEGAENEAEDFLEHIKKGNQDPHRLILKPQRAEDWKTFEKYMGNGHHELSPAVEPPHAHHDAHHEALHLESPADSISHPLEAHHAGETFHPETQDFSHAFETSEVGA